LFELNTSPFYLIEYFFTLLQLIVVKFAGQFRKVRRFLGPGIERNKRLKENPPKASQYPGIDVWLGPSVNPGQEKAVAAQ